MLFIRLLRFLRGSVRFAASGGFPERFINLCAHYRIILWDVRNHKGVLYAETGVRDYKRIRPAAHKSGMRLRAQEKHGLPFFLRRHRRRIGLPIGLAFFLCITLILSTRIWSIEVIGHQQLTREELEARFAEVGLTIGCPARALDINSAELRVLAQSPELAWVNLNIRGSSAVIEVREKGEPRKTAGETEPMDVTAVKDGTILTLDIYMGTAKKRPGDAVLRGDILISGETVNRDESTVLRTSQGYAAARTRESITVAEPFEREQLCIAQERDGYTLLFLGFAIPLTPQPKGEHITRVTQWLALNGRRMPLGFTRQSAVQTAPQTVTASEQQARLLALEQYCARTALQYRYARVENETAALLVSEQGCTVQGEVTAVENIGRQQPIASVHTGG